MKGPLISVIVPIYKVPERFLRQCIESLTRQTLKGIEILLVDDGSPDRCGKICDEYEKKDSRIRVIHKANGGLVSARNAGFDALRGKWHMYVDGDDWIDTDTCSKLMEYAEKYPDVDIFFWKCIVELEDKPVKGKWEWPCNDSYHLYQNDECKELSINTLIYKSGIATAYCKLIRSDFAKDFGIRHDERLRQGAEGLEFSLRAFYYARMSCYINAYYNHYRYNPDSISKAIDERNTVYLTDCFNVINEDVEGFETHEAFVAALYQRLIYVLIAIAMQTYFHPRNKNNLFVKSRKYKKVIEENRLFRVAVKCSDMVGMDIFRKIAFTLIRLRLYFMLAPISYMKQYYLKRGKYGY